MEVKRGLTRLRASLARFSLARDSLTCASLVRVTMTHAISVWGVSLWGDASLSCVHTSDFTCRWPTSFDGRHAKSRWTAC